MFDNPNTPPPETSSPVIVGIDLGTTMSAVALYREGKITFFENMLGDTLTPSVVAHDVRSQGLVVGRTAKEILAVHPTRGAAVFKPMMGSDTTVKIGDRELSPVELSAYVLDALRADAERALGTKVERCVVTVPAYFDEPQRQATIQAAEIAGLKVERILNEPTAAALAHGLHEEDAEHHFVVLDLGGGTFDVCAMELFEGMLEVRGVAGVSQLGGEDFTQALKALALSEAEVAPEVLGAADHALLLKRAELLKRKLSRWPSSDIRVPTGQGDPVDVTLSRADAETAFRPLLDRMLRPCRNALSGAKLKPQDLSDVILVGGATRMPCIVDLARDLFGMEPTVLPEPDHAVVRGAAIQAALCSKDASVADTVVTDVASHTLGIQVTREVNGRMVEGFFSPLIERNTTLPTTRSEVFSTVRTDQTEIEVTVFEGEQRKVLGNKKLGELHVPGIPDGPPRDAIEVRFTYDPNGLLEVEATILETGETLARVFQRGNAQLKGKALTLATERLQRLKATPRDRPRHRDLLARAEALWSELDGSDRPRLTSAIEAFEAALEAEDTSAVHRTYDALHQLCQQFDHDERW